MAAQLMAEQDVSLVSACVGGRLVGVVTDRDIVRGSAHGQGSSSVCLGDLGHVEPMISAAGDSWEEALGVLAMHQVHCPPVIVGDRLAGILSQVDMAHESDDSEAGATVECITK